MTLQQIVARLRDQCPSLIHVGILHDIHEIETPEVGTPAAFVMRLSDSFEPNEGMGALVSQARRRAVAVIVIAETPTEHAEPMEDARTEIQAALVGWEVGDVQMEAASGEADQIAGGLVRWRDVFAFTDYARYQR